MLWSLHPGELSYKVQCFGLSEEPDQDTKKEMQAVSQFHSLGLLWDGQTALERREHFIQGHVMVVQSDFSQTTLCIQPANQRFLIGHIQLHRWLPLRPAGKWVCFFQTLSLSLFYFIFSISMVSEFIVCVLTFCYYLKCIYQGCHFQSVHALQACFN